MPSQIVQELIQALNEEIDTLKNSHGRGRSGNTTKVFNGRFLREVSGLNVYVFNLENFLTALDDSPAEIEINNYRYTAQILLTQGLEVEIGIERFSSKFIAEAMLYTNSWYLLELLRKKLEDPNNNLRKTDFSLSEALFLGTLSNSKSSTSGQTTLNYSFGEKPPNEAQKRAIEASFSFPLSIVWGPPGTGKTRTVARAVEAHLNAGRSVLLVSHANNAVDEALEDIANHLKSSSFYQEGKLVRLGKSQEDHLKILEGEYPLVILDNIAEKLGESLSKEKHFLENEKIQIDKIFLKISNTIINLAKAKALSYELNDIKSSLSETLQNVKATKLKLVQIEQQQKRNQVRLQEAQSAGGLKRFFSGLQPEKIQREIDQVSIQFDMNIRTMETNTELQQKLINSIRSKETDLNNLTVEINDSLVTMDLTEAEVETKNNKYDLRKNVILSRIAEIKKALEEIQKNILSEAKLVATTLTKTYTAKQFPNRKFDVVILDEASMAPLPHLYWAIGLCNSFITIIGDFLQLPPICVSESPIAKRWLARSIFDVLDINTIIKAQNSKKVNLLDTQYRMVPAISEITNRFVYLGVLKDDFTTSRKNLEDGVSSFPIVLVETGNMNAWCSQLSSGGRFNLYHALVCTTLAKKIIQKFPDCKIGIITPYRHQARLINKIAKDWQILASLRVSTIHTFQGGEEQIIIFDTTEGIGIRTAPMLDDTKRDSDALRVLNVALTRAKDKLYLVANTKRLLGELNRESLLSRIVLHFQQKAEILDSNCLVDNYFTSDFEKWSDALLGAPSPLKEPISGELYTERNFWAQFINDIKLVKQRLIILSPFVSVKRSGGFMDFFKSTIERGIEITIFTRPAIQQIGEMANQSEIVLGQLRSIGVSVIERRSMHQKVAVIDNEIAWEGSLNILSHRDSGEQMRRFLGPSAIEEIIRNLELTTKEAVGNITQQPCPGIDGKGCKHNGYLVIKQNRARGNRFYGCSSYPNYPICNYTAPMYQGRRTRQ